MNQISGKSIPWLKQNEPDPIHVTSSDLDLTVLVRLVRRRLGFILGVMVVMTAMALPFIAAMTPNYRAEARFLITPVLNMEADSTPDVFIMVDEVERLRARAVVDRVVSSLDLGAVPEFNPTLAPPSVLDQVKQNLFGSAPAPELLPAEVHDRAVLAVYDRLSAWRQTDSILQLSFKSTDPELAAAVPNAIITSYAQEVTDRRDARVKEALTQLRVRQTDQAARVAEAHAEIAALRTTQAGLAGGRDISADQTQLVLLNQQLAELQSRRAELKATVSTVDAALNDNGPAPLNETEILAQLRRSLEIQQRELARLTGQFGEAYGGVQTQRAQVAELEGAIDRELTGWAASMRSQLAHIDQEETTIQGMRSSAQGQLSQLSANELQMANLVRRADSQTTALDAVDDQIRLLETVLERPALGIDVLTPAAVPLYPEGKGRKIYVIIVLFGGALLGLTLAGVLDLTDRSVRSHQQMVSEPAALPVGLLPKANWPDWRLGRQPTDPRLNHATDKLVRSIGSTCGGAFPESLLITSTRSGDGSHFVAAAISQTLASLGREALIIDILPRRSRFGLLHRRDKRPGFADYLRGDTKLDELLHRDPATGHQRMWHGTGTLPPIHDDALISTLIERAAARGLITVFIGPPAHDSASVVQIAGAVQRVLLVMRWGRTSRDIASSALDDLREHRTDRVLTVINRVEPKRHARYNFRDSAAFTNQNHANLW